MYQLFFRKLVVGVTMMAGLLAVSTAFGYTTHYSYWEPDTKLGHHVVETDDGEWLYVITDEDYNVLYAEEIEESGNPDPENGTTTPGDRSTQEALLKQQGGTGYLTPFLEDTPLGAYLADHGIGIGPYHNPYGDDGEGGLSPSGIRFYDPYEESLDIGGGGSLGSALFHYNAGSVGQQLKNNGPKKGTGGDDNGDGDGNSPPGSPMFDDFMVGPPELINPNPTIRSFRLTPR